MADEPKVEAPTDASNAPEGVTRDSVVPTESTAAAGAEPATSEEEAKDGEAGKGMFSASNPIFQFLTTSSTQPQAPLQLHPHLPQTTSPQLRNRHRDR